MGSNGAPRPHPSLAQRQPPGCVCDRGGLVLPRGASDSLPAARGCAQVSQRCAVLGAHLSHWGLPCDPSHHPISPTGGLPCDPSYCPVLGGTQCQSALQSGESRALPSHPKAPWPAAETHPPSQVRAGLSRLTSPVGHAPVPSPCPGPVRRLLPSPGRLSRRDPRYTCPPTPARIPVYPQQARCHALQGALSPSPTQKPGRLGLPSGAIQHPGQDSAAPRGGCSPGLERAVTRG